ncbi:hypothetical protein A3Q56_07984 [Intoshia linei]|uniref:Fork-head domain-containing protein n=1 Tax=Intoshia linei TaxID=1819745 RepID=A0A177ASF0_9BILA|nr:hypothetical protein A3Q56_07984 [Intoshia linei]
MEKILNTINANPEKPLKSPLIKSSSTCQNYCTNAGTMERYFIPRTQLTYLRLCYLAICMDKCNSKKLTEIYLFLHQNFLPLTSNRKPTSVRNSIRHCLTKNAIFMKCPKDTYTGSSYWRINPQIVPPYVAESFITRRIAVEIKDVPCCTINDKTSGIVEINKKVYKDLIGYDSLSRNKLKVNEPLSKLPKNENMLSCTHQFKLDSDIALGERRENLDNIEKDIVQRHQNQKVSNNSCQIQNFKNNIKNHQDENVLNKPHDIHYYLFNLLDGVTTKYKTFDDYKESYKGENKEHWSEEYAKIYADYIKSIVIIILFFSSFFKSQKGPNNTNKGEGYSTLYYDVSTDDYTTKKVTTDYYDKTYDDYINRKVS